MPSSFTAEFEEVRLTSLRKKIKKSYGDIYYKYPGQIRFEVKRPHRLVFVRNMKKTWIYRASLHPEEPGQLTETSNSKKRGGQRMRIVAFLDLLKGDLAKSKQFKMKKSKGVRILHFNKSSQKELGLTKATLEFKEKFNFKNLNSLEILKSDGKKIHFNFFNIQVNKKFIDSTFIYKRKKK